MSWNIESLVPEIEEVKSRNFFLFIFINFSSRDKAQNIEKKYIYESAFYFSIFHSHSNRGSY